MSKYHSRKVEANGIVFDSSREADRWLELKRLEESGTITDLQRQVKFELIPTQKIDGRVKERPITYIADFTYYRGGAYVVEDVKPKDKTGNVPKAYKATPAYREFVIKRKLMLYLKGIAIREV